MITVYYDVNTCQLVNADGSPDASFAVIVYGQQVQVQVCFRTVSNGSVNAYNVSSASTWAATIDIDRNSETAPCSSASNNNINSSGSSNGNIIATFDTKTAEFLTAVRNVGTGERRAMLEFKGYNSSGKIIHYACFPVIIMALLDDGTSPSPSPPSNYLTAEQCYATFVPFEEGTRIAVPNNTSTVINLYEINSNVACTVRLILLGSAGARFLTINIFNVGGSIYDDGGNYFDGGNLLGTISTSVNISGGYAQLSISNMFGEDLTGIYVKRTVKL